MDILGIDHERVQAAVAGVKAPAFIERDCDCRQRASPTALPAVAGVKAPAFIERPWLTEISRPPTTRSVAGVKAPAFIERAGSGSTLGINDRSTSCVAGVKAPAFIERTDH